MNLRCKPGDLAVIVKSVCGNEGKIVRCIRLATLEEIPRELRWRNMPMWVIDIEIQGTYGPPDPFVWDDRLRPIRDPGDDAEDEMLQRVGKPEGVTA